VSQFQQKNRAGPLLWPLAPALDCRNCRPMYSAGMWRQFSVAGTQRTAIGENVSLHISIFIWGRYPTSAQHPPCLPMSLCSKAQTQRIT